MPDQNIKISVILPAYNEKENLLLLIPEVADAVSGVTSDYEILLIDDGSTDGTHEIAEGLIARFPSLKYIRIKKSRGLSVVLAAGFEYSSGQIIVTMDSDLQYDPRDIPRLLENIDGYDMVCCHRQNRRDTLLKRISSKIANKFRRSITKDEINDAGCIFRAFRKECLKSIALFNGFHRFLPALFKFRGFKVIEIKVKHLPRRYGESKYNIRNRIFKGILDTLAVKWMQIRQIEYEVTDKINI